MSVTLASLLKLMDDSRCMIKPSPTTGDTILGYPVVTSRAMPRDEIRFGTRYVRVRLPGEPETSEE